ncbi:H/ACA ribonucleoprotein complex subunit GAR1 [Natronomonas salsuginis]|jgi:RNA-binding protein|uniref:H/ACA RNA-protein complex component Gar1 n=1 Tax=Natronomonas salsuginis TaxID=2217661 RepID=A0A4V5ZPA0_9EURY|nr:Gar1/Naf1 family protein [Natronomonas salsuginis]TKR28193.1 H/ACA RNA-protein complex component Gar1 [Natronomonas salsuginis]
MKRVGEVVRTAQGLAIVRSPDDSHPKIGTELLSSDLDAVGRVVDVFGPVDRPYVAVSPDRNVALATLLGEKLYAR